MGKSLHQHFFLVVKFTFTTPQQPTYSTKLASVFIHWASLYLNVAIVKYSHNLNSLFVYRFLHAVAYRWLAKWFFGYFGLVNTKGLLTCAYTFLWRKYPTCNARGFATTDERE